MSKLRAPWHEIDEEQTSQNLQRLGDAIGDVITINVDRAPFYRTFLGDISYDPGHLRGIEHFMADMIDNPEWLHGLVSFVSEGTLRTHDQVEAAGDRGLRSQYNRSMSYSEELPGPVPNVNGVKRSRLWTFMAARGCQPAMHEEFMLRYQLPMPEEFGLVAY